MENLKNVIEILKKDRIDISNERDVQTNKIASLTTQLTDIQNEIEEIKTSLTESESKLNNLDSTIKDTESGYNKLVLAGENLMSIVSQSVSDIDKKLLENSTSNTRNNTSNTRNNRSVSYKINSVSAKNNGLDLDINNFKK
jgi:chromosome segregation ATPase